MSQQYSSEVNSAISLYWGMVGEVTDGAISDQDALEGATDWLEMELEELGLANVSAVLDAVAGGYGA